MADACSMGYQAVVNTIEGFLTNIDGLTDENTGRLSELGEVSNVLADIEKEKGEVKGTPRVDQCIMLIKNVCSALLFGSYPELLSKLSDFFSMVNDMENKQKEDKSFELPEAMQARVDAVKHYLKRAQERLEKIDDTFSDLKRKVSR